MMTQNLKKKKIVKMKKKILVLNKFSKTMQDNAKSNGFDLIFTKKMLIRSIRDVIIHVSNE